MVLDKEMAGSPLSRKIKLLVGIAEESLFLSHFLCPCASFRFLPPPVPQLQTKEEHWLLHPADIHAFHPDYHPLVGLLLDQLRRLGCQSGPG